MKKILGFALVAVVLSTASVALAAPGAETGPSSSQSPYVLRNAAWGRPFGHVVATGESFELTPWLGNMSFENVVAHPDTGTDATVAVGLDDGDATVGQQVYVYAGTKTAAGNPVQKAGLTDGTLYGIKVADIPQSEYQKTDWQLGDEFDFELVDVSQYAGFGGTTRGSTVDVRESWGVGVGVHAGGRVLHCRRGWQSRRTIADWSNVDFSGDART